MTTTNWIQTRKRYIGASEVACLYGVGYTSKFVLWHEKAGLAPEREFDDSERLYWGKKIEPIIIDGLREREGIVAVPWDQSEFVPSDVCPGLGCTPDAIVYSDDGFMEGVCEIKNVGEYLSSEWRDGVPLRFQCQCQAQIATMHADYAIVAALVGGNRLVHHRVERHEAFILDLYKRVAEFWSSIESGEVPSADGSKHTTEFLKLLHPDDNGETIQLGDEFVALRDESEALGRVIKDANARCDEIDNTIRNAIGDATFGVMPNGSGWSWKTQERKEYVVKASKSRVLRFTKGK